MSVVHTIKDKELEIQKFINWDKFKNRFYNNIYLEDCKIVIKMPLIPKKDSDEDIKIKKFNLEKIHTFLISY